MSRVKLNSVLFEYMEKIIGKKDNYNFFLHELFRTIDYFEKNHYITLDKKELEPFFRNSKKEETIEKLLKAFMFGYEEESDTYTIVLFERDDFEFVLWEVDCYYEVSTKEEYHEDEVFRKSFTRAEILNKFPELWSLAQKNK